MVDKDVDILIIGGGLIGAAMLVALQQCPYRVMLVDSVAIDARVQDDFDARSLALSPASVRILEMLAIWPLLMAGACPIDTIHVSERAAFGCVRLQGEDESPLGYVVEMQQMHRAFYQRLNHDAILAPSELVAFDAQTRIATVQSGKAQYRIYAKMVIAADGAQSQVRQFCHIQADIKSYQQQAIVANIATARSHQHIAYERFTSSGPLALLPMQGQRVAMVWSLAPLEAKRMLQCDDAQFLQALQKAFGYRLGRLLQVGKRAAFPLQQVTQTQQVLGTTVFIGNAAHTLHPVAGQGFNLGLRDVAMLAQCIVQQGISEAMLQFYQRQRASDHTRIVQLTDGLIQLFTSRVPGAAFVRRLGMLAIDQIPLCRSILARYARGFGGILPDLVCGIPLEEQNDA